jgi:hypothetical protein
MIFVGSRAQAVDRPRLRFIVRSRPSADVFFVLLASDDFSPPIVQQELVTATSIFLLNPIRLLLTGHHARFWSAVVFCAARGSLRSTPPVPAPLDAGLVALSPIFGGEASVKDFLNSIYFF